MTRDQDKNAKEILEKVGMQVTSRRRPRSASSASWRSRPCKQWAEKEIGKPYVDGLFKAVEATKK